MSAASTSCERPSGTQLDGWGMDGGGWARGTRRWQMDKGAGMLGSGYGGGQGLLVGQYKHCVHTLSATTTRNNIGIGNAGV